LVPVLCQTNPVHKFSPSFPKIHFNIILLSTPSSSDFSLPSGFFVYIYLILHAQPISSFVTSSLGSTAQLRPWPPPQNPAEFLGGFSQFSFYRVGFLAPRQTPIPEDQASVYLYPPEAGWLPILVASYDTHGLRWDYSYSPVTSFLKFR
jgi:hypothetical protein